MNPFDTIRTERPTVHSITPRRRSAVRDLLLGPDSDEAPDRATEFGTSDTLANGESDSNSDRWDPATSERPRRLLLVAAVAIVIAGVAGLVVALRKPVGPPVIEQPPAASLDSVPASEPPTGEPGDAQSPPATLPLPIEQTGGNLMPETTDASRPVGDSIPDEPAAFTPLVLSAPPQGFTLFSATYMPGPGGFGIARYRNPESTTELHVVVRDSPDWTQQLTELGRPTTDVNGRTVYAGGEGNGDCLSDVCQIDLQFDDRAGVSIMWVTVDATPLRDGSTREALLPLVPTLVADPSVWVANTSGTQFPLPTSDTTPLLIPFGPGEASSAGTVFGGPPGSSSLTLRSSDGSVMSLLIIVGPDTESIDGPDDRRFGDTVVRLLSDPSATELPLYRASHSCWTMQVSDGSRWADGAWSEAIVDLLESARTDDAGVVFDMPAGWEAIASSGPDLLYEVQFSVPRPGGGQADVTVLQAPGQHAYSGAGTPSMLTPFDEFDAFGPGWTSDPAQPEPAQVFFEANGWSYVASSSNGLASGDLLDLVTSMTAISIDDWIAEFGPVDQPDNDLVLDGGCAVPVLSTS